MATIWRHRNHMATAVLKVAALVLVIIPIGGGSVPGPGGSHISGRMSKVLVFLKELCAEADGHLLKSKLNSYLKDSARAVPGDLDIVFVPKQGVCETKSRGLSALVDALSQESTSALIGSLDEDMCDVAARLADLWGKPLLSWSCPQTSRGARRSLAPSLEETAAAIVGVSSTLGWKSIVIITSGVGWWPVLANKIELGLLELGVTPRHIYWEDGDGNDADRKAIRGLRNTNTRVIVVCASLRSSVGEKILRTVDSHKLTHSLLLALDLSTFVPYLPRTITVDKMLNDSDGAQNTNSREAKEITTIVAATESTPRNKTKNGGRITKINDKNGVIARGDENMEIFVTARENTNNPNVFNYSNCDTMDCNEKKIKTRNISDSGTLTNITEINTFTTDINWLKAVLVKSHVHPKFPSLVMTKLPRYKRTVKSISFKYDILVNVSENMKKSIVLLTSYKAEKKFSDEINKPKIDKIEIFDHIMDGIELLYSNSDNRTLESFEFVYLDWRLVKNDSDLVNKTTKQYYWNHLLTAIIKAPSYQRNGIEGWSISESSVNITKVQPNFNEWYSEKGFADGLDECEGDFCLGTKITMTSMQIVGIIIASVVLCFSTVIVVSLIRTVILKKRLAKGPNKILLNQADFVFPQVADSRRVDEGIEAMLCCWLQQLQEFGGPEVDKPDLLKGSIGSLKVPGATGTAGSGTARGPSSNGSLTKTNCIVDTRTRYNGDMVHMRYLPTVGTFELKTKAMDILVAMHGLRHENLNPFIGFLPGPERPALVFENCSRGSLEDVLIADEIKLDWTFRLSLLTDLVRGMRYLHGTSVRVHGHLTSRNCAVDARWVLKVTDYALSAFGDAQGLLPNATNSRDLLWTAPEVLRDAASKGRNGAVTPPADVYSFGIIMQEVVVRGEPFCMLALTPEEIIEKVKKPPPLIRPSVSKGAAPPEAINIMRQCWTEQPEMRPDFNAVYELFRKLNHGRKVNFVDTMFQMLEKYSNNLEELIRERTEQLDMEKKKTEQLLNRMLPSYVAEKLKFGMPVDPEQFDEVSIYFSDIVGFTAISAHSSPFQVVDLLNDLYTCFDATINAYNVYKVETIGDAYMVVGGLPVRVRDHAEQIATMALDLLHQSGRFRIRHLPKTPLRLRIGLHTGPCCAGVVGLTMPRYCLFGDTVNTASRMESTGAAWRIHLSQTTRDKLEAAGGYALEYRGPTEIKGKGKMPTYWLLGKAGFDKTLPTPPPLELEESLLVERSNLFVTNSVQCRSEDNSSECSASGGHSSPRISISPKPPPTIAPESLGASRITLTPVAAEIASAANKIYLDKTSFSVEGAPSERRRMSICLNDEVITTTGGSQEQLDGFGAVGIGDGRIREGSNDSNMDIITELPSTKCMNRLDPAQIAHLTLGTPVSASEVAAALLGASSTSLSSNRYRDANRYKRSSFMDHDLSTPYNHYRCLSPSDSNINQTAASARASNASLDMRPGSSRLLKRQFSLDRADDLGAQGGEVQSRLQPRLFKQNSAGAAHDLERIEEIPLANSGYKLRLDPRSSFASGSMSVSVESLAMQKR